MQKNSKKRELRFETGSTITAKETLRNNPFLRNEMQHTS